jgi:hypothetical protein
VLVYATQPVAEVGMIGHMAVDPAHVEEVN